MKLGITHKLFLAILAAALLSVAGMMLVMQWSLDRGFLRYVNNLEQARLTRLATRLETEYVKAGSWSFIQAGPLEWHNILRDSLPDWEQKPDGGEAAGPDASKPRWNRRPPVPMQLMHGFGQRIILLDAGRLPLVMPPGGDNVKELRTLYASGKVVGYLGILPRRHLSDERQLRFLKEQKSAFAIVAVVIVLLAAGLSVPVAARLIRPVRALAKGTDRLAAGDFTTRVPVDSSDELGQLARDFNSLAIALEKNEKARREWVADISHELRTPLAILQGEIEALQDGIRPLDREAVNSLHAEAMRLKRLVDDLYHLALSDAGALSYRMEELELNGLLSSVLEPYSKEFAAKGIELTLPRYAEKLLLFADSTRLRQLFSNLLDNSLKYTDPGGRVVVGLETGQGRLAILVEDSAPGVARQDLERIFERLYRVEASRSRAAGGAGLGLAICREIVLAHGGAISAGKSQLGGVAIRVELPLWGEA